MNYYQYPKLIWFKNDDSQTTCSEFEPAILEFMKQNFTIKSFRKEYGSISYNAPDKDNQFIEGYLRDVYYVYEFDNHFQVALHFYTEESGDNTFEKTWPYNFYCLDFFFTQGCNYSWIKSCHQILLPFMAEKGFRDASYSYTYETHNLYNTMKSIGDEEGMREIAGITEKEILDGFLKNNHSYIEIQHKSFLDINRILSLHPDKTKIKSIQINHNGLQRLPDALFQFINVESLCLYHNPLKEIDARLSLFSKLKEINLHSTGIAEEVIRPLIPQECRVIC